MTKTQKTLEDIRFEAMENFFTQRIAHPRKRKLIHYPEKFPRKLEELLLNVGPDELERNVKKIADMMRKNNWDLRKDYEWNEWTIAFGETRADTEEEIREKYKEDAMIAGEEAVRAEMIRRQKARDLEKNKENKAKKAKVLAKLTKEEREILGI